MTFNPSPQQEAVYQWIRDERGNLILIAVAGSGKTTTVLHGADLMDGTVAYCAYGRKIAEEISRKLREAGKPDRIRAGTFHSFGFSNWRRQAPKVKVDADKVKKLLGPLRVPEPFEEFTVKLVSLAKQRGIGALSAIDNYDEWRYLVERHDIDSSLPDEADIEDAIGFSVLTLKKSMSLDNETIDFDDMIFAPLAHKCRIWQNDWIVVDEAQDTNPARRALARKMLKPSGRAVFVGDPHQAIYGFTGADNDSLDLIEQAYNCKRLPQTVTYRCPKSVVRMAQNWVHHIEAHETAPEGSVTSLSIDNFHKLPGTSLTNEAAMLCRNTAPLVAEAYSLIRRGIACQVEGKQIGHGLLNLLKRWKTDDLAVLEGRLHDYMLRESEKFILRGQEQKAEAVVDKVETIKVFIEALPEGATVRDLKKQIMDLFGDTPEGQAPRVFTLSTVHKSKGREWPTVYLLNRQKLMPSPFARQAWQQEQEDNLIYVAVTRAMNSLVEVVG